jgi:hypothetical protein
MFLSRDGGSEGLLIARHVDRSAKDPQPLAGTIIRENSGKAVSIHLNMRALYVSRSSVYIDSTTTLSQRHAQVQCTAAAASHATPIADQKMRTFILKMHGHIPSHSNRNPVFDAQAQLNIHIHS